MGWLSVEVVLVISVKRAAKRRPPRCFVSRSCFMSFESSKFSTFGAREGLQTVARGIADGERAVGSKGEETVPLSLSLLLPLRV